MQKILKATKRCKTNGNVVFRGLELVRNGPNSVQKLDAKWNPERSELQESEMVPRIWCGFGSRNGPNWVRTGPKPEIVVKPMETIGFGGPNSGILARTGSGIPEFGPRTGTRNGTQNGVQIGFKLGCKSDPRIQFGSKATFAYPSFRIPYLTHHTSHLLRDET